MKLNLGSNNKIIGDDWINVDGLDLPNVNLISPGNDSTNSSRNHTFICNVTDSVGLKNITQLLLNQLLEKRQNQQLLPES